ncbi:uridine phosphorylase 1-like [Saccoglossus kowalevskii]|uniref:Uridine phosphorylase 1-like n=1 Tax=Saccoglossus kowalevskii TaxID=10224 RepID=A0ABM0GMN1_SACKO|nr:PREDICTED: uridine phosphorylase 1-like [Saccoglossus kowalevskii]
MYTNNQHLMKVKDRDVLLHFGLATAKDNFEDMFGDVKFVCSGGSMNRMKSLAALISKELNISSELCNLCSTDRYVLYKVGPVLTVSHGMGMPSTTIMLHEIIKLLQYAKCKDVKFFRIGTCGGLSLEPGTLIVTGTAVDYKFEPVFEQQILGKIVSTSTTFDKDLAKELLLCKDDSEKFEMVIGNTMSTNDFYEGQARLDGAFCDYTEEDKMKYLHAAYDAGVKNIEMEALCIASMMNRAGMSAAVLCVSLLDRLKGDEAATSTKDLNDWQKRPLTIVTRYIKSKLEK